MLRNGVPLGGSPADLPTHGTGRDDVLVAVEGAPTVRSDPSDIVARPSQVHHYEVDGVSLEFTVEALADHNNRFGEPGKFSEAVGHPPALLLWLREFSKEEYTALGNKHQSFSADRAADVTRIFGNPFTKDSRRLAESIAGVGKEYSSKVRKAVNRGSEASDAPILLRGQGGCYAPQVRKAHVIRGRRD